MIDTAITVATVELGVADAVYAFLFTGYGTAILGRWKRASAEDGGEF